VTRILFLIVLLISCTKEYSVETNANGYDFTLTGTGNGSYQIAVPGSLIGKKATVNFYVTLYSSKVEAIGRNDYVSEILFDTTGLMKFTGNPVLKDSLILSGTILLPDTLFYFTTTYYVPFGYWNAYDSLTWPQFRDTITIKINQ
jgi:hypothetical protein